MRTFFRRLFRTVTAPSVEVGPSTSDQQSRKIPRLLIAEACVASLATCMEPEINKRHEGIAYLAGRTDGSTTLVLAAIRPDAETTYGSFRVDGRAMAKVVRSVADLGLQVVGQVHTHPGEAYHSGGDDEGARIAYSGYVSLVLPDYGKHLPAFHEAALFMYSASDGFLAIDAANFAIVPGLIA